MIDELETLHILNIVYWPLTGIKETESAKKEKGGSHAAANNFTYSLAFLPSEDPLAPGIERAAKDSSGPRPGQKPLSDLDET